MAVDAAYVVFYEVVRQGSIRKAAEHLHISASSVSRQIHKLEREFDAALFDRSTEGVKLTAAGEVLERFVHARSREMVRLRALMDELKRVERGHLSVHTVEGMLGGLLPRAVATFSARYPRVTLEIVLGGTDDVMRAVAGDRCDIGIAFEPQPRAGVDFVARMSQPVLAVMAPDHDFAGRPRLDVADLTRTPLGVPDRSFGIRHIFDAAMQAHGLVPHVRLETNSIDMLRRFAADRMGVSLMPGAAIEREAALGSLVGIAVDDPHFATAHARICTRKGVELPFAARAFLELMLAAEGGTFRR